MTTEERKTGLAAVSAVQFIHIDLKSAQRRLPFSQASSYCCFALNKRFLSTTGTAGYIAARAYPYCWDL
eukprot:6204113-Pleurochrysis_carterae.AAC.1